MPGRAVPGRAVPGPASRPAPGPAQVELSQQRWPGVESAPPLVLVPVGSLEQHGPHLPLGVDTLVAAAVAREVARRMRQPVSVAPAVAFGASGEHEDFPGTVSVGHDALRSLLVELGRSACRWASGLVLVNGHGGNLTALVAAVRLLRSEGRPVAWTSTSVAGADGHAGRTETSLVAHLTPWSLRADLAAPGATEPVGALMPRLRAEGVRAVSPSGVLGDPTGASAEEGARILEAVVVRVLAELRDIDVGEDGRLRRVAPAGEPPATRSAPVAAGA